MLLDWAWEFALGLGPGEHDSYVNQNYSCFSLVFSYQFLFFAFLIKLFYFYLFQLFQILSTCFYQFILAKEIICFKSLIKSLQVFMPQGRKERKQNLYGIQNLYFTLVT